MKYRCAILLCIVLCCGILAAAPLPPPGVDHPLQPLTAQEIRDAVRSVRDYLSSHALPIDRLLFPTVVLKEPAKQEVVNFVEHGGAMPARRARVEVMHYPSNRLWVAAVDLTTRSVLALELQPAATQASVTATEFLNADTVVHADAGFKAAIRARGLDPDLCYVDVWAPGDLAAAGSPSYGPATRILRALAFYRGPKLQGNRPQNPYDRPVEGLVITLDMNAETVSNGKAVQGKVIHITDTGVRPTSSDSGNADEEPPLNPLTVQEPQGPNYTRSLADGRQFHWQGWSFYAVLQPREGLVLYDVRFDGRRIAYRASLSEIYVPYGIGDANWNWRTAFDVGEYLLGTYAQALEVGKDVPDNASFLNATFATDSGSTVNLQNSIAAYEKFSGFAWTRTDPATAARDTRGARSLMLTWNAWIGNYIYGFDWVFSQDGALEVVVSASGTTLNRATAGDAGEGVVDDASSLVSVAPRVQGSASGSSPDGLARVRAPNHQHFFNFRIDFDIDGPDNIAGVSDVVHVPPSAAGGALNMFTAVDREVEAEGAIDGNIMSARTLHLQSASATNLLHGPTAYEIEVPHLAFPLSEASYPPLQRAAFAGKPFWITRYKDNELYAAGDHPNQGVAGEGLPAFVADQDPLNASSGGADVVAWVTTGFTHVPKPEDYPVMSAEHISFRIAPHGFFNRNPALRIRK